MKTVIIYEAFYFFKAYIFENLFECLILEIYNKYNTEVIY